MRTNHAPWTAFLLLCAVAVGEASYSYLALPARVAVHFDINGRPNGWATNIGFSKMIAFEVAVFFTIFLGVGLLKHMPDRLINLPNKDYWLARERRDAALAFLRDWTRWFLVLTFAFIILTAGMVVLVQTSPASPRFSMAWFWPCFAGYASVASAMMIVLFRRFRVRRPAVS